MFGLLDSLGDWMKEMLASGVMDNLRGLFIGVNLQVANAAVELGTSPEEFEPEVFDLIKNLAENVITPIAGLILTFVACYELIQLVISHNNLANFETWIFFKWIFKTFIAVTLISNTMNICMAVFDVSQAVILRAGAITINSVEITNDTLDTMRQTIEAMDVGELMGVYFQTSIIYTVMGIFSALVFVIVYARLIEIYLTVSLAPIPFATFASKEQGMIGQNYLRSLLALGFQGFLIVVCLGIYAVLVRSIAFTEDIVGSLWGAVGYTILLLFTLFKTGALAKSVFHAH